MFRCQRYYHQVVEVDGFAEFPAVCARVPVMGAHDLWCLPGWVQKIEYDFFTDARVTPVGAEQELGWDAILLPSTKARRKGYRAKSRRLRKLALGPR